MLVVVVVVVDGFSVGVFSVGVFSVGAIVGGWMTLIGVDDVHHGLAILAGYLHPEWTSADIDDDHQRH